MSGPRGTLDILHFTVVRCSGIRCMGDTVRTPPIVRITIIDKPGRNTRGTSRGGKNGVPRTKTTMQMPLLYLHLVFLDRRGTTTMVLELRKPPKTLQPMLLVMEPPSTR